MNVRVVLRPLMCIHPSRLTNRSSQALAAVMTTFNFMKQFLMFATPPPPAVAQLCLVRLMENST